MFAFLALVVGVLGGWKGKDLYDAASGVPTAQRPWRPVEMKCKAAVKKLGVAFDYWRGGLELPTRVPRSNVS